MMLCEMVQEIYKAQASDSQNSGEVRGFLISILDAQTYKVLAALSALCSLLSALCSLLSVLCSLLSLLSLLSYYTSR